MDCSESFYKKCVEDELRLQQSDSMLKQSTLEMLQRIYDKTASEDDDLLHELLKENTDEGSEDEDIDSDDENVKRLIDILLFI